MYGNQTAADFLFFPSAATMDTDQTAATSPFLPPAAASSHHLPSAALLQHYQHALSARILMDSSAGQRQSSSSSSSSPPPPPNTSSSSSGLPGGCPMQRSLSSHSLAHELFLAAGRGGPEQCYVEDSSAAVRRVFSAGDLHQGQYYQHRSSSNNGGSRGESPLSSESSVIIESMSRACKYTPEEKQQRIERYRTKRNHRNFNKKIKYECRKTLADSRPRIRGRFARNDEIITDHNGLDHVSGDDQCQYQYQDQFNGQQWSSSNQNYGEECYDAEEEDDDNYWVNFLNAANSFP
ncbi:unnamed protein product [Linum tenue]|uniref:CCT domain-containing protein n=1 Tax=Linum tenue TaxID=586396 RepID=A0AAV0QLI7_9ROSI|nr:unnamed protein product [Linum tenue]